MVTGRISVGKNVFCPLFCLLVMVSFTIHNSCAASDCWDCDKADSRGRSHDIQSSVEQHEEKAQTDTFESSNALDCLFRDPPQDTLEPSKQDKFSKATQKSEFNNNQTNNQEISSFNHSAQDVHAPQPPARWSGIDTLVAIFFAVAAIWLIAATIYSITLLVLIRLQARGELDIYDEDLGRFSFCNGRFSLHFGCILRRYAIQLERDYQRRLRQRYGNPNGHEDLPPEPGPIRIMTREERRHAVEQLLGIQPSKLEHFGPNSPIIIHEKTKSVVGPASPTMSVGSSQEGPECSICLDGYEPSDVVFKSTRCAHMFHKDCLMEWLERRNNSVSKYYWIREFPCRDDDSNHFNPFAGLSMLSRPTCV
jgi:hypothetical protein